MKVKDLLNIHALHERKPALAAAAGKAFSLLHAGSAFSILVKNSRHARFLGQNHAAYDNTPRLLETVNAAIRNVPYYQALYGGLQPRSLAEFESLIAFTDRNTVLQNDRLLRNPGFHGKTYMTSTGGTSGKPLSLVLPSAQHIIELSTMFSLWSAAGFTGQLRAVIRNHRLSPGQDYILNPVTNELIFDGFRMNEDYFEMIYETIRKRNIHFIHCYPSCAYSFALFLRKNRKDTSFIRAFLSGSENIYPYYKTLIEDELNIRFYNWYGHSEKLILGGYCRHSDNYHIEPTYGYFELVDDAGNPVREPGKTGEIAGTTLYNAAMPLIRYRTGDHAEYIGDYCPECGRHLPLIRNVRGRWSGERIYNSDGSFITTTALNLHDDLYRVVNGIQFIQTKPGELEVLIIKSEHFDDTHLQRLKNHFASRMAAGSEIRIRFTDELIKQPNGKFLLVISSIPLTGQPEIS